MITRDDIRELANFHSPEAVALTFYFQPETPANRSHRQEAILVKDLLRNVTREAEKNGRTTFARPDLDRISGMIDSLQNNGRKAKAIFSCASQNFWREFEVPPQLPKSRLILNQRFHLKPLASLFESARRVCIVVADRTKARVFTLSNGELAEKQDFVNRILNRGQSDGWNGYDAGHVERKQQNEAIQHFRTVSEYLTANFEREGWDALLIGCHDESWSDIEAQLHSYLRQRLVGRFRIDPKTATPEQVKQLASAKLEEYDKTRKKELIHDAIGEAHRNGRGAIGLRRVLRSIEAGEVQVLLLGSNFEAPGVKCYNCGHIDMHVADNCAMCGKPNTILEDIGDAIVGHALRSGIEIVYIEDDDDFEKIGRIATLLRFRADQNTPAKVAV